MGGPFQPADRFEVAGQRAAGELLGDLLGGRPGVGQGLAGGTVQVAAFGGQHVAVDGLADQVVAERQPVPVADDQARPAMPRGARRRRR